jgi:hypothetical protein
MGARLCEERVKTAPTKLEHKSEDGFEEHDDLSDRDLHTIRPRMPGHPGEQPWPDLMGLLAVELVVILPCRPVALIRMDVAAARIRDSDGSLIVPTQEKTDSGKARTELVVRTAPERPLSAR